LAKLRIYKKIFSKGFFMTVTISKWGNSQGFRVPKDILDKLNLAVGDLVNISQKDNKLIIEPAKKEKKYSIDELVNNLPKGYKASEEFSSKSGSEIW
jgi:antitoxin MazE